MTKPKIKLNLNCEFCRKEIVIGKGTIIENQPLHFSCFRKLIEKEFEGKINRLENPYPQDIFRWDNNEKLDFNRGRFNQHCFEVWGNCKEKILEELKK